MIIKEVKFSYIESRYGMGPYVEFFSELEVPSLEYDDIVRVIEDNNPDYKNVKVMSYSKTMMQPIKDRLIFKKSDRIFFTADTHWGHRNIIRYCQRPFSDVEEMNEALITNWNNTVSEDDIVFHLGDFAMGGSAEWSRLLERLNGKIYLILGNHDMKTIGKGFSRFEHVAMQMLINIGGQKIYLNHYPFLCYGGAYKNTWQLFGHVHTNAAQTGLDYSRLVNLFPTQYDVGVDNNNYMPISFEQVNNKIKQQLCR